MWKSLVNYKNISRKNISFFLLLKSLVTEAVRGLFASKHCMLISLHSEAVSLTEIQPHLLRGRMDLSSPYASSHSATYSFRTVITRTILVASCITRFVLSFSLSRMLIVSYEAFNRSTQVPIKSSWISTCGRNKGDVRCRKIKLSILQM